MHELVAAFDRADAAPEVGVVVLTGAGDRAFSTGGDVDWENAFEPDRGRHTARLLVRLSEAVRGTGKPVIAKIRGWCVGGGNEPALFCDLAVAAESARFLPPRELAHLVRDPADAATRRGMACPGDPHAR